MVLCGDPCLSGGCGVCVSFVCPPTPPTSPAHQQKDPQMGGGTSIMTSLPFFYSCPPSGFQPHWFLPHPPRESGGHHLYRCLGIKAPWPLLLGSGLRLRWRGAGGEGPQQVGVGGTALCSSQRRGLQFPQTRGLMGGTGAAA